jgi:hypothetical protein
MKFPLRDGTARVTALIFDKVFADVLTSKMIAPTETFENMRLNREQFFGA